MSLLSRLFRRREAERAIPQAVRQGTQGPAPEREPASAPREPARARDRAATTPTAPRNQGTPGPPGAPVPSPASRAPAPKPEPAPAPAATVSTDAAIAYVGPPLDENGARAILESVLDDLGTAHHRPFSRG